MSTITIEKIQKLREKTLAAMGDVKKALEAAGGDEEKALLELKKRGKIIADKKSDRETKAGLVASYIHSSGTVGALVSLKCETDFVAKNKEFQSLAHDLAMHIVAMSPKYLKAEDVPADVVEAEKTLYKSQIEDMKKPANIIESIIEGKLQKFYSANCLLSQNFVKDDTKTIQDLLAEHIAKLGERIEVGKFVKFEI